MGTTWSEEANKDSSSQQAHQPALHSVPESTRQNSGKMVPPTTNNNVQQKPKEPKQVVVKLPHNYEAILKDSDSSIDKSSIEKLYEQLYSGVYLNGKKKKYWLEKKANTNCFMIFASGLAITWGGNPHYWNMHNVVTSEHGSITVAQLRDVCWLEVHGRLHAANLSPGVTYQVAYHIMLELTSYGWEVPVNFRLTLPNGSKQEHKENLNQKPKGEWIRIPVGEFKACPETLGDIEFSLYEYEGGNWKKGLVIKGASIEPKI